MHTVLKGDDKKRNENYELKVLASKEEIKYFINCGNHTGKDNVLFFNKDSTNEVFLLLHGNSCGKVQFNGVLLSLKEVYEELQKENVFNLLSTLNIKYIFVLCCHGFFQESYQKNGVIIKLFFNNKGKVLGEFNPLVPNEYRFVTEEHLAA